MVGRTPKPILAKAMPRVVIGQDNLHEPMKELLASLFTLVAFVLLRTIMISSSISLRVRRSRSAVKNAKKGLDRKFDIG